MAVAGALLVNLPGKEDGSVYHASFQASLNEAWSAFEERGRYLAHRPETWTRPQSVYASGMAFFLMDSTRVLRWTSNEYVPDGPILHVAHHGQLIQLPMSTFLVGKWTGESGQRVAGILLFTRSYPVNNPNLPPWNNPAFDVGAEFALVDARSANGLPVYLGEKEALRIQFLRDSPFYTTAADWFFLAAWFLLVTGVGLFAWKLASRGTPVRGLLLFLAVLVSSRLALLASSRPGSELDLFDPRHFAASWYNPSLGDLVLNLLLVLAVCAFIFASYHRMRRGVGGTHPARAVLPGLYVLLAFFVLLFPVVVLQTLFNNSRVVLDVSRSLEWDAPRWVAYACVLVSGLSAYLLHHVLFRWWQSARLAPAARVASVGMGAALFSLINLWSGQSFVHVLVIGGLYWLLLAMSKLASSLRNVSFLTFLYWLTTSVALAGLWGISVRTLEVKRQTADQFRFGTDYLADRDPLAEYFLNDAGRRVAADPFIAGRLLNPFLGREIIREKIRKVYLRGYLGRYDSDIRVFDDRGKAIDRGPGTLDSLIQASGSEAMETEYPGVVQLVSPSDRILPRYRSVVQMKRGEAVLGSVVVELTLKRYAPGMAYRGLLLDSRLYPSYLARDFSYALFSQGEVLLSSGEYSYYHDFDKPLLGDARLYREGVVQGGFLHAGVEDMNGRTFVVTGKTYPFLYLLTNMSFYFTMGLAMLLVAWGGLGIASILRGVRMNYTARIQLLVSIAFFIPLTVASSATIILLNQSTEEELVSEYGRRIQSASVKVAEVFVQNVHERDLFESNLTDVAAFLSQDITYYGADGRRIASTEQPPVTPLVLSSYLNPEVFDYIVLSRGQAMVVQEKIGILVYQAAYAPVFSPVSGSLQGVVSMPVLDAGESLDRAQTLVVANILVIFSGLFVLFVLVSFFTSRGLTYPLRVITGYLKGTSLTGHNRPIVWKSEDEIGLMATEYNKMLATLERNKAELERSNRESAWREIAQQVAHEIRNPLTPMKLTLQQVEKKQLEGTMDPEALRRSVEAMLRQVSMLDEIAGSFSAFARLPTPNMKPVNAGALLEHVMELHGGRGSRVSMQEVDPLLTVLADEDLMSRSLSNLVLNALQSADGGSAVEVRLGAVADGDMVEFRVSDNGRGVDSLIAERIFLPHFTTKKSGSGLGLAILKQAVEQMGGSAGYRNNLAGGATFYIRLPKV
jgi:signal transduction histidine kinase